MKGFKIMIESKENYYYLLGRIEEAIKTLEKQIAYAEAKLFVENHEPSKLVYHAMIREKTAVCNELKLIIGIKD
jgi:hypothetical protein